jgi:hypothetical protein
MYQRRFIATDPSRPGNLRRITHFGQLYIRIPGCGSSIVRLSDGAMLTVYLQYALEDILGRPLRFELREAIHNGGFVWEYDPDETCLWVLISDEALMELGLDAPREE